MLETNPPDEPHAFTLAASTATLSIAFRDGSWQVGEPEGLPTTTIRGDDSTIGLFALGRIGATDPRLTVEGDMDAATRFKEYFPGP